MSRWVREFRLMPVVLIAIGCLFALKTIGLIFDGGYTLAQRLGGDGTLVVTTVPGNSGCATALAFRAARDRIGSAADAQGVLDAGDVQLPGRHHRNDHHDQA